MRYPSKIDWWIIACVALAPIGMAVAFFATRELAVLLIGLVVIAILGVLCFPCDYTLESDHLLIRSGLMKWKVAYADIESIELTNNPLSSPAWSLERIAIKYGKSSVMISPVRREEFLNELRIRARLEKTESTSTYSRTPSPFKT